MAQTDGWLPWISLAVSVLAIALYELRLFAAARRRPAATARSAHGVLRADWVAALSRTPGTEVLAVQALRNALMSATVTASTAALGLMGSISLTVSSGALPWASPRLPTLRGALELILMLTLFAAFVCSAFAIRYYHHTNFVVSLPVGCPERAAREAMAVRYVQRAGVLYSWSLRCFLLLAPSVVGLLHPWLMPLAALTLILVLRLFDRAPEALDA